MVKCGKIILVSINLLLVLVSLALLIIGIIVIANEDLIPDALDKIDVDLEKISIATGFDIYHFIKSSGVYLVVIGCVLGFISLSGCCGACFENNCMLRVYMACMVVIMLSEIALIILVAVFPEQLKEKGQKAMLKVMTTKFKRDMDFEGTGKIIRSSRPEELGIATMQIQLECCGAASYSDYEQVTWIGRYLFDRTWEDATIPASCCKLKTPKRYPNNTADFVDVLGCIKVNNSALFHQKGCYDGIVDLVNDYATTVIGVAAGVLALELILVALAMSICRRHGSSKGDIM